MLTAAQEIAIHEHRQNLIVVAGAGSGKTYVLVERYLALLDANPTWSLNALVAITFTKKAAQEMRDRVRLALEKRYREAVDSSQRDIWAGRIGDMDSARIDTVHGLCASILRANAAEAGVDPGFEVLDEVEARVLLDDVVEGVLQAVVHENDPAIRLLTEYEIYAVTRTLLEFIAVDLAPLPRNLRQTWQKQWEYQAAHVLDALTLVTYPVLVRHWHPEPDWPREDKLFGMWERCWLNFDQLNRSKTSDEDGIPLMLDALKGLVSDIKLNVGAASAWGGKERLQDLKAELKAIREAAAAALKQIGDPPGEADDKAEELLPLWVSLIHRAQTAYWKAKQDDSLLDFDDLERLTRQLLQKYPAVQARYRANEFKHILVDEFQDTNAAQWDIVRGLADINRSGSVFVVGDPKQSIYRFRGADVSVFDQVRGRILDAGGQDVALARSFRTHQRLVECFNHLFEQILVKDAASPVVDYEVVLGEPMEAERHEAPTSEPPLEFLLISKEGLTDDDDDSMESRRRWEAYEIAQRLRHIKEHEQRLIYDKQHKIHRPIDYGDMAILFQSTSNINLYEDVFKAAQLPFVTVAGRGYYSRQEVWDLLNLLTALHNPADQLALATALRSPLFGLSDDALLAMRMVRDEQGERAGLWDVLDAALIPHLPEDEIERVQFARDCLYQLRGIAGRVTIAVLLREILDLTGYLAVLTGLPDGARRRGNVEKLLEKAESSGQVTLGVFSHSLRDLTTREVREGEALVDGAQSVTLMTVHASKGLEYPLVVLVDAGWTRGGGDGAVVMLDPHYGLTCKVYDAQQDKLVGGFAYGQAEQLQKLRDVAERKRLLYVAATRAQDYLLVSGQMPSQGKDGVVKADNWLGWLWGALNFDSQSFGVGTSLIDGYGWGQVRVTIPEQMPSDDQLTALGDDDQTAWEHSAIQRGEYLPGEAHAPVLLAKVPVRRDAIVRHLTATQIADLGAAKVVPEPPFYRQRFRRQVMHDAPTVIEQVSTRRGEDVSGRIIGEMVHKVLGWPSSQSGTRGLDSILQSYAWELGVVNPGQQKYAVQEALKLLERTHNSQVFAWMEKAKVVYRELPFVYRTDRRIIHGILDVLLQRDDGSWVVVDYKTSYVDGYAAARHAKLVIEHAQRYHLQVGVYAAAVREQLGDVIPEVYIYYIRYGQTVRIQAVEWQTALEKLEDTIGDLLTD